MTRHLDRPFYLSSLTKDQRAGSDKGGWGGEERSERLRECGKDTLPSTFDGLPGGGWSLFCLPLLDNGLTARKLADNDDE